MITNENQRLSQRDINRMIAEAKKFAEEVRLPSPYYDSRRNERELKFPQDEYQRKRIEALNSLSSVVYGIKNQVNGRDGLGGKITGKDKDALLLAVKNANDWIDENGGSASVEDLEGKLTGTRLFHCFVTVASC